MKHWAPMGSVTSDVGGTCSLDLCNIYHLCDAEGGRPVCFCAQNGDRESTKVAAAAVAYIRCKGEELSTKCERR